VPSFPLLIPFLLALCTVPAAAQDAARTPAPATAASNYVAYTLVVDGPDPPAAALRQGLDLVRWQADEEMTPDLLERLVRDATPQARSIAAIEGFYDAAIDISIDRDVSPIVVKVKVEPGPRTTVGAVAIDVTGPATHATSPAAGAADGVRERFLLRPGDAFRQADWIRAKDAAVREMRRTPYAAARLTASEARVDPDRARADLALTIDSGPPFRFGPIAVQGTQRYPPSLVENFSTLERGAPHAEAEIDTYVRRLAASGYFGSVQATIDVESANPDDAAVKVAVIEAPTHRVEGSISFSTDTRYGGRVTYTNINLDDAGLQMRLDARAEDKLQYLGAAFTRPPTSRGWIDRYTLVAKRDDFQNTVQTTAGIGAERRGIDERKQPIFAATYYFDREDPEGADAVSTRALYLEAGYVLRRADDLLSPTRGYMVEARAGGGVPGASTAGFLRATVKSIGWYPIDRVTGLTFRADAGGVFGTSRDNVPSILLFRTGGDTTVRGYEFESLGVPLGDATVGGRYYALASVEVVRWINELWGIAAFVDAGDAADSIGDLEPAIGVGIGARLATPIGPFRLDVAYGEETRKWRIHFSVGLSF
jgi:translocation and assembly module TamA